MPFSRPHSSRQPVYLTDSGGAAEEVLPEIASYLSRARDLHAVAAGDIASRLDQSRTSELALALARARVHDFNRRDSFEDPLPAEVSFLERQLTRRGGRAFGHAYDGMAAMSAYRSVLAGKDALHLVFTNQIVVTWDEGDLRYHARVLVAGSPSIISVPGVVAAPARPREYYLYQQAARAAGASDDEIELKMREIMGERYVTHGDPRIPEILKGYALQAAAYWILGEPFCDDPLCRLFNAHWQEEMIRAQLGGSRELCERHSRLLGL